MTVDKLYLAICTELVSLIGSNVWTLSRQHDQCASSNFIEWRVCPWLAVTCHLHYRQNDQGLLPANARTCGWNEHQHKSKSLSKLVFHTPSIRVVVSGRNQDKNLHRKLIREKKIFPPLLPARDGAHNLPVTSPALYWVITSPLWFTKVCLLNVLMLRSEQCSVTDVCLWWPSEDPYFYCRS